MTTTLEARVDDNDPHEFPDLTGLSPSARRERIGFSSAKGVLQTSPGDVEDFCQKHGVSAECLFQAAWVKVLIAYIGETDVTFTYTSTQIKGASISISTDRSSTNGCLLSETSRYWNTLQQTAQPISHLPIAPADSTTNARLDIGLAIGADESICSELDLKQYSVLISVLADGHSYGFVLYFQRSFLLEADAQTILSLFDRAVLCMTEEQSALVINWNLPADDDLGSIANGDPQKSENSLGRTVHEVFAHHAKHQPDRVALDFLHVDGDRVEWTFGELDRIAERIVDAMYAKVELHVEDSVPICVPKSPEFYACVLAVMKAGASFTPFSNVPRDRKAFMRDELDSKIVLYSEGEDVSWCKNTVMLCISNLIAAQPAVSELQESRVSRAVAGGENLVYQMYTSGSTGRPKAVSLEHRNVLETVMASRKIVPWDEESRMLQYAAPSFDMCYYDTFLAWTLGITLCSASDKSVYNDLTGVINSLNVNLLGLTPSVAVTLDPIKTPSVKWLYCIGEALPQNLVDTWNGKLVNSYGPTEAAQMVTLFSTDPRVKSAVIGKPFPNTSFYVLGQQSDSLVPILSVGELCIGGLQVAREYHRNEEKTKSAFIEWGGNRLYRTGDLVRMLGNGDFEFVGRVDDQVKIRGQRVELGEINQAIISAHEAISSASAQILKPNDRAKEQLVGFIVLSPQLPEDERPQIQDRIKSHLEGTLPPYMVPKIFLFIDQIPLSAARKIDRKALRAHFIDFLDRNAAQQSSSSSDVWTKVEQIIRKAYANVADMPLESITRHVTIFELGIDSIAAIQVAALLRREGLRIDASDVLSCPSIATLTSYLESRDESEVGAETIPMFDFESFESKVRTRIAETSEIDGLNVEKILPCTPLQTGMLAQTLHSERPMYFNRLTYTIPQGLSFDSLFQAWSQVIEKHQVLRTGFVHTGDHRYPMAMVLFAASKMVVQNHVVYNDSTELSAITQDLHRDLAEHFEQCPWRVIVRSGQMHLIAHHALYDAQVLDLWIKDLTLACDGSSLPPPAAVGSQLSKLLYFDQRSTEMADTFWTEQKDLMPATKFPVLTPLKSDETVLGVASRACSMQMSEIEERCKKLGISLQVAGQTSWGRILSEYTGEDRVTFGTVLSGRTLEGTENIGIPCITTVPTPLNNGLTQADIFQHLLSFNAKMQKFQFTPLKRIERLTGHVKDALFDSIFTVQKRNRSIQGNASFRFLENSLNVDYPVSLEIEPETDGRLMFQFFYRHDRVPTEQADLLVKQFDRVFCDTLTLPKGYQDPVIEHTDRELFSVDPAREPEMSCQARLLHELFEESVRKNPSKAALEHVLDIPESDDDILKQSWSYSEVEAEGNKVAQFLVRRKVKVGSIVAICFDKCPEAAFTMLGISKAGCSFLAVDPGAPPDRKRFIVEDSNATMLITKDGVLGELAHSLDIPVVGFDEVSSQDLPSTRPILDRPIDPQDLSYCLYTSGTTGLPKGCAITHENVVQVMMSFQHLYKSDEFSRWLQFASYHFDVSVMEHFWTWSAGMCCVTASRDLVFTDLPGTIKKLKISHIDLTPSLARTLDPSELPTLANGVFVVGGEMLRQDILDRWGPTGAIHNAYGPTEATIGVTMFKGVPVNGRPTNIGYQFPNVGTFVMSAKNHNRPVLRGAVGELCVSGKLVAKGYISRPELTSERFIMLDGIRSYRTGDLVRILHDGSFDILGRVDDQVKLRGQRLEIGEINSVIKQSHESALDVSTQVLKHPKQKKEQLVAFIVIAEFNMSMQGSTRIITEPHPSEVFSSARAACGDKLPPYMVPTHFLALNKLPLSTNNKADSKRLKELYAGLSLDALQRRQDPERASLPSVPNQREEQQKITRALASTLGISAEEVDPAASFFELGLDSISIIGLSRALRTEGIKAPTAMIMRSPSAARLAESLLQSVGGNKTHDIESAKQRMKAFGHRHKPVILDSLSLGQDEIETIAPCTPLQQGIISKALKNADGTYFNLFRFEGIPSERLEQLKDALQRVIDNVPVLRSRFVATDDGHAQVIIKAVQLPCTTLTNQTQEKDDSSRIAIEAKHVDWCNQAFESQTINPVNVTIVDSGDESVIGLGLFHACYDGRSLALIIQRLIQEFNGERSIDYGPPFYEVLPYGPLNVAAGSQNFWKDFMREGLRPFGRTFPPLASQPGESSLKISRKLDPISNLERCRRSLDTTHQAIFETCWSATVQDCADAPVIVGLVLSGTTIDVEGADRVIGPTFNTVPFLHTVDPEESWQAAIKRCHIRNAEILTYQHTPLRDIQKFLGTSHHRYTGDIFNSIFVFQRESGIKEVQLAPWKEIVEDVKPDYPLAFEVNLQDDDSIDLTMIAQQQHADSEALQKLLNNFESCLQQAMESPDSLIGQALPELRKAVLITSSDGYATSGGKEMNGAISEAAVTRNGFVWNDTSEAIRYEVARLADVDRTVITPDTSILEVGLDSINAVMLSSRLRRRLGHSIPVSKLMAALTIKKIASLVSSKTPDPTSEARDRKLENLQDNLSKYVQRQSQSPIGVVRPCTPLQEAMAAEMFNTDFRRYLNFDVLKLDPKTDVFKLERAWRCVIDKTPLLHSRIVQIDDPAIDIAFALVECEKFNPWNSTRRVDSEQYEIIFDEIRRDMAKSHASQPPIRLTWLQNCESGSVTHLVLTISHVLYDGWSIGLIHEAVSQAYYTDQPSLVINQQPLESLLARVFSTNERSTSFWKQAVQGSQITTIQPRQDVHLADRIHRLESRLEHIAHQTRDFCRQQHVTVAAFTQTVWSFVLANLVQQLDVTFGVVLSGRDSEDAQKAVFPLMNTVVSRSIIHGSLSQMVKYTQHNLTSISEHQHFPLRKALRMANGGTETLFNTLFIYQKSHLDPHHASEKPYESVNGTSDVEYPLCVEAEIQDDHLIWRLAGKDGYISLGKCQQVLNSLDHVTKAILRNHESDAVTYQGERISVGGLPSFQPKSVDLGEIMAMEQQSVSSSQPWSDLETKVREAVARVGGLEVSDINRFSDIMSLGLDSISVIKVSALLRVHGVSITVNEILRAKTIAKIAESIERKKSGMAHVPSSVDHDHKEMRPTGPAFPTDILNVGLIDKLGSGYGIDSSQIESVLPATAGQVFMLSKWQNSGLYLSSIFFKVHGVEHDATILASWKQLVAEKPILRAVYIASGDWNIPIIQVILKTQIDDDLHGGNGVTSLTNDHSSCFSATEGRRPLQPARISLSPIKAGSWQVEIIWPHSMYDGYSLHLMLDRLRELMSKEGIPNECTIGDYDGFHRRTAAQASDTRSFWTKYLNDLRPRTLQITPMPKLQRSHIIEPWLSKSAAALRLLASSNRTTFQSLLIAVWAVQYATITKAARKDDDVLIGIYTASRNFDGAEILDLPTLGFVPVRVKGPLSSDVVSIAQQIQHDLEDISQEARSSVGLWQLRDWLGEELKVDSFVNLIIGEGVGGSYLPKGTDGVEIVFEEFRDRKEEVTEMSMNEEDENHGLLLKGNAVRNVFQESVDFEATLYKDSIDVGILAPHSLLSHDETKSAVRRVGDLLDRLSKGIIRTD